MPVTVKLTLTPLELVLVGVLSVMLYLGIKYRKRLRAWWRSWHQRRRAGWTLHPWEPKQCSECAWGVYWLPRRPRRVKPWSEVKSRAGRPKISNTDGYACLDAQCDYFANPDATEHALVFDGKGASGIQQLKCQACGGRHTSRLGTPMYQIKTPLGRVVMVMTALSEGMDVSAASRVFGHHPSTITRWLGRGGPHSQRLHDRLFQHALLLGHVQLDELVTRVKQGSQQVWVWTAIDAQSKLFVALHLGRRTTQDACRLVHQLAERLAPGSPLPVFTSDGLNAYFYGLTAHFGFWHRPPRSRKPHWSPDPALHYAQLFKAHAGRRVKFLFSCSAGYAWAPARLCAASSRGLVSLVPCRPLTSSAPLLRFASWSRRSPAAPGHWPMTSST